MQNVTEDRHLYIGGSDVPVIMGLSPFKTRWELLQEKAQIIEPTFTGNAYTEYGNVMEGKIRDYVNELMGKHFVEDKKIIGTCRYHADGYDEECNEVLEIKTTSQMHNGLDGYKKYLVQLLYGQDLYSAQHGVLAVYERPNDWSEEFNPLKVQIYEVDYADHRNLIDEIFDEVDRFELDLAKLKANPLLTDEDLQPKELIDLSNMVYNLEVAISEMRKMEETQKELKAKLKEAMEAYGVHRWHMNNGTKITLVADSKDTVYEERELDMAAIRRDLPELWRDESDGGYMRTVTKKKKGRKGYVRITLNND